MSERVYCQCRLRNGTKETTSYIPVKFAKQGDFLQLKDEDGNWEDGWEVLLAGSPVSGQFVENQAHNCDSIWKPSAVITTRGNK